MAKPDSFDFGPMTETGASETINGDMLADLGLGQVAYLRQMTTDELSKFMPESDQLPSGFVLWALLSAEGRPICLSESKSDVLQNAKQQDLVTVSLH